MAGTLSQNTRNNGVDACATIEKSVPSCARDANASDMLIGALAHDLRAPLRNMRTLSSSLSDQLGVMASTNARIELLRLNTLVEKTSRMVDDLLLLRRSTRRHQASDLVNLSDLVQDSIELGSAPRRITIDVTGGPTSFRTAKAELALVMRNMIGNAIRHHDRDQGAVTVAVRPLASGRIEFLVRDDGPGLPPALLRWLTKTGDQADESGHVASLGLMLAVAMVRRHGGKLSARSGFSQGRGTEIIWAWPALT